MWLSSEGMCLNIRACACVSARYLLAELLPAKVGVGVSQHAGTCTR